MGAQSSATPRGDGVGFGTPGSPRHSNATIRASPFAQSKRQQLPSRKQQQQHAGNERENDTTGPSLGAAFSGRWAWSSAREGAVETAQLTSPSDVGPEKQVEDDYLRRPSSTTSTATPGSLRSSHQNSRGFSSSSRPSSAFGSRPSTSHSLTSLDDGEPCEATTRLLQARQRANTSLQALELALQGFGNPASERYASWPAGCSVLVSCDGDASSCVDGSISVEQKGPVLAQFVRYTASSNTCEVKLRDGAVCAMPPHRVARAPRAARYETWQPGCPVRISCGAVTADGATRVPDPEASRLRGSFVSFDASTFSCEVRLADNTTRIVPAQLVTRAKAAVNCANRCENTDGTRSSLRLDPPARHSIGSESHGGSVPSYDNGGTAASAAAGSAASCGLRRTTGNSTALPPMPPLLDDQQLEEPRQRQQQEQQEPEPVPYGLRFQGQQPRLEAARTWGQDHCISLSQPSVQGRTASLPEPARFGRAWEDPEMPV